MTNQYARLAAELAPTGILRAAINVGNPILANLDADGNPFGVSADLAGEFAHRLGVPLKLVVFDTAGKSVEAVTAEQADFGFFAIDPVRGAGIAFTEPYVLIEGAYLVKEQSTVKANEEVDLAGRRVVVGKGSAYDLYLTRTLQHAHIVRAATSPAVVKTFLEQGADVAAGVRQQLEADAKRTAGLRLLPGRFMVIQQAMGLPKARSAEAVELLRQFVEEMKASCFVSDALRRHGIEGASVAPSKS
ncbi:MULTISPECIES: ABC transporter substrate-binding protein [Cupriavidus]|uniref:Polar amino acid transport system substrate-binding protein n=1 Tax=Cupriavidus alkaliphilus TaxID=942866 RepID=A0A7W4YTY8_9BURK|nr:MULTISPECIES: ABC transporter substrate-binding protein [Cupriavidus]MBB3009942.1 polar amino acid transport system substrate-binding protein [Cupriavidus alkaliphilus]GLC96655.1 ABC transporter substrate-binding protein [Cupriavidus sp. TA19]